MIRRIANARGGYIVPSENPNPPPIGEQRSVAPVVVSRRRALGDITNAFGNDEGKENNKKPVIASSTLQQSDIGIEVLDDVIANDFSDRSYMQRPSDDIDARDAGNPLLASSYVNPLFEHFGVLEKEYSVNPGYMANQPYINDRMRCILIDWLVEVHLKFKMVPETLYLTVNIIDRYLQLKQVRRSRLQLVGVATLLIAAKYEEIYPPEFRDLVYITDRAYNKQEILEMESEIVNTLYYQFTIPTIHSFLCRYLKAAHADRAMVQLACYLAERTLQEHSMIKFLPSVIAATSVYIARKSLRRHPWSPTLLKYTNYDEDDLSACADEMKAVLENSTSQQQAVLRKYSSPKFGAVARMPLVF